MSDESVTATEQAETGQPAAEEQSQEQGATAEEQQPAQPESEAGAETPAEDSTDDSTQVDSDDTGSDSYEEFALPDNVTMDESVLGEASSLMKEAGLNQDQAQKFVDFFAQQRAKDAKNQVESFNQLISDWRDQSANDKEFGGDAFEENVGIARSAIDKFGTPELKQLLEDHGVGNHPEVIRFMFRVGKLTKEDVPGTSTRPASAEQSRVDTLYPNARKS